MVGSVETTLKAELASLQLDAPIPIMGLVNVLLNCSHCTSLVIPQCCDFTSVLASELEGAKKTVHPNQMDLFKLCSGCTGAS